MPGARPRVLLHVVTVPETLGFLRGHAANARNRGWEVHAASSPGRGLADFGEAEGVAVHAVSMKRSLSPASDIAALTKMCLLMRRLRPLVVDAHTPKGSLVGIAAAYLTGVPIRVFHLHGARHATLTGIPRLLLMALERLTCALATDVVAVSPSLRDAYIADRIVMASKVSVVGPGSICGVDHVKRFNMEVLQDQGMSTLKQNGLDEGAPIVGYFARVSRDKGVLELAEAWPRILRRCPNAQLLVVGGVDDDHVSVTKAMEAFESSPRVRVLGYRHDVARLMAVCNVIVLPSHREGFGQVVLEANALGVPVVASNIVGLRDAVVDGSTGRLFKMGDVSALTRTVIEYLEWSDVAEQHGHQARIRVQKEFDPSDRWNGLNDIYDRSIDRLRP